MSLLFLSIQAYKTYKFFSSESPTPCSRREDMQLVSNHLPLPVATGNNGDRYSHKVLTYIYIYIFIDSRGLGFFYNFFVYYMMRKKNIATQNQPDIKIRLGTDD